jgi:hypothetical protein
VTVGALRGRWRKVVFVALYACAMAGLLVGGLKLVDSRVRLGSLDELGTTSAPAERTVNTVELFPFDGMHVQANFHHRGPMPWNDYTPDADFDIRTGDKGYFVDFPLENPPPKAANEFRIVLVGGSGAQGWGATRNENMFYRLLEYELNQRLASRGVRVRVVNLAMGTSFTYQNFIALNQWGHALEPDLILAYTGRNDFFVPLYHEGWTDRFLYSWDLGAFAIASRGSEVPPGMQWLFDLMPNMMRRTSFGLGLKIAFGWEHFKKRSVDSYEEARGMRIPTGQQVVDEMATPLLIHALKSIKRDFEGVPILLAWQAVSKEIGVLHHNQILSSPGFYDRMYERCRSELGGYLNDRWYFFNVNRVGEEQPQLGLETHLSDNTHQVVSMLLASRVDQIMPELLEERARRVARGLPAGYGRE